MGVLENIGITSANHLKTYVGNDRLMSIEPLLLLCNGLLRIAGYNLWIDPPGLGHGLHCRQITCKRCIGRTQFSRVPRGWPRFSFGDHYREGRRVKPDIRIWIY